MSNPRDVEVGKDAAPWTTLSGDHLKTSAAQLCQAIESYVGNVTSVSSPMTAEELEGAAATLNNVVSKFVDDHYEHTNEFLPMWLPQFSDDFDTSDVSLTRFNGSGSDDIFFSIADI